MQGLWIPSGFGIFDNSSLNLVYLPVTDSLNEDYLVASSEEHELWGLKLYALIGTTDVDLYVVQKGGTEESGWGVDFASNIYSNLEVHGEYAVRSINDSDTTSALIGTRYLTENDITWILEGYHNSAGLTKSESRALFNSAASCSIDAKKKLVSTLQNSKTLNQNYAYLKVSIKEPFNWLYFTPSGSVLVNLDDSSTNTNLQMSYSPGNNWE